MVLQETNLAIVDDHSMFRKALTNYLSNQDNIKVVIQASNISEFFRKLKDASVDILVIDLFLPQINVDTSLLKSIRNSYPGIKILVLSVCTDVEFISDLLDIGIYAYVSKTGEIEELIQALQEVAENRVYRNKLLTEALYWEKQNKIKKAPDKSHISLNDLEIKLLQLIWDEKGNKEIANELFLGIRSVEKMRQDLKEKLGVKSTVGLIKYAINNKIITIGSTQMDTRPAQN
jgi:DNA-binding NarL/FixJ family response regulator